MGDGGGDAPDPPAGLAGALRGRNDVRQASTGATSRSYASTPRPLPAAGFTSTNRRLFAFEGSDQRLPGGWHSARMRSRASMSSTTDAKDTR